MNKLSADAETRIRNEFLSYIGKIVKLRRSRKNISQTELGEYLGVAGATVSRYEAGKQEMLLGAMPLISYYCQFPIRDYFVYEDAKKLTDTFKELVNICATEPRAYRKNEEDGVVARIVRKGDKEYRVPTQHRKENAFGEVWKSAKFQGELDTSDVSPFTADEMAEYLMIDENADKCKMLEAAGTILAYSRERKALTMQRSLAGFVIEDCLKEPDEQRRKRLVAYYRLLCQRNGEN